MKTKITIAKMQYGIKSLVACLALTLFSASMVAQDVVYLKSNACGLYWGENGNVRALDTVFGSGNWKNGFYETTDLDTVLTAGTKLLYIDGSNCGYCNLVTFLDSNHSKLEAWVALGGHLILNAAPNSCDFQTENFYFGGVSHAWMPRNDGYPADSTHPIFKGSYSPVFSMSYLGNSVSHSVLTGQGLTPILIDVNDSITLAEKNWGSGKVFFGGLTLNYFYSWNPQPNVRNFFHNLLEYAADSINFAPVATVTSVVSDSTWKKSTTVTTATANTYPWAGVTTVPGSATFTDPALEGQPYPYVHMLAVDGSQVIKTDGGVTYFRQTFELTDHTGLNARFRMYVDDNMEIFINGKWMALEDDMGPSNYRGVSHDILFKSDGTVDNGHMGGDAFDFATTLHNDSVFKAGENEIVLAIRNRTSKPDIGGFSFRMDLDKGGTPVIVDKGGEVRNVMGEAPSAFNIDLFPNPAKDYVTIRLDDNTTEAGNAMLSLYDLTGKLLVEQAVTHETSLNMAGFSSGVYLVKVVSGSETYSTKLVKE